MADLKEYITDYLAVLDAQEAGILNVVSIQLVDGHGTHTHGLTADGDQHDGPEGQLVMLDHGNDEVPAKIGDHIEGIAAGDGEPFQGDGEYQQQHNGHTEGRHVAQEQEGGKQNLVPAFFQVGGQGTQKVTQDPAGENCRQLQTNCPHNGAAYDVGNLSGVLAEGGAEVALQGVLDEAEELLMHGQVGAEFFFVALVDFLDGGCVGHALGHFAGDGGNGVSGHHTGQEEVQDHGHHEGDGKPEDLFTKIFTVAFLL